MVVVNGEPYEVSERHDADPDGLELEARSATP